MTQNMKKEPILQMGTDKTIPRHVNDKPFTIRQSQIEVNGKMGSNLTEGGLIWYIDGSKTHNGTEAGVYCHSTRPTSGDRATLWQ
jgi:hypothetical protein